MERFLDDVGLENVKATGHLAFLADVGIPPAALGRLKGEDLSSSRLRL